MRDLRLAVSSTVRLMASWWRNAFAISLLVHAVSLYAAGLYAFRVDEPLPLPDLADFFFSVPDRVVLPEVVPAPAKAPSDVVAPAVEAPAAETREPIPEDAPPAAAPEPLPEPTAREAVEERELPSRSELEEARLRAADEIIAERAAGDAYLTFSIDDVAPPRPVEEPEPKYDIFNPGPGAARSSVGQVGQGRTRLGNKLRELCNAFGGFAVGFQGFHLFDACGDADDEPSGLFPEVRRAYMDMLPECAESQPENPELAAAAPFSTVKCRLVRPVQVERWAYPGQPGAPKP